MIRVFQMLPYEVKMHWRRRALMVIILSNAALISIVALLATEGQTKSLIDSLDDHEIAVDAKTMFIMLVTWVPMAFSMLFILPIAIADTIPLERQKGTAELLNSMPLTTAQFLQSKVFGSWLAVWLMIPPLMLFSGAVWWIQLGTFDVLRYASMWLLAMPLLVILNGTLGLLIPALVSKRRAALAIVAFVLISLSVFVSPNYSFNDPMRLIDFLHPARGPILLYYFTQQDNRLAEVLIAAGWGLGEIAVVALITWVCLRRRESTI